MHCDGFATQKKQARNLKNAAQRLQHKETNSLCFASVMQWPHLDSANLPAHATIKDARVAFV